MAPKTGRTKALWVREPYLAQILAGRKTIEVRVGYDNIQRLQPGDPIRLNDEHEASAWFHLDELDRLRLSHRQIVGIARAAMTSDPCGS